MGLKITKQWLIGVSRTASKGRTRVWRMRMHQPWRRQVVMLNSRKTSALDRRLRYESKGTSVYIRWSLSNILF